jgi:hypothetical protein
LGREFLRASSALIFKRHVSGNCISSRATPGSLLRSRGTAQGRPIQLKLVVGESRFQFTNATASQQRLPSPEPLFIQRHVRWYILLVAGLLNSQPPKPRGPSVGSTVTTILDGCPYRSLTRSRSQRDADDGRRRA